MILMSEFGAVKQTHANNQASVTFSFKETKPDCTVLSPQPLIKPVNCPFSSAQLLIPDTII